MAPSLLRLNEGAAAVSWLSAPFWIEGDSGTFDIEGGGGRPERQDAFGAQGGHVPMSHPKYAPVFSVNRNRAPLNHQSLRAEREVRSEVLSYKF